MFTDEWLGKVPLGDLERVSLLFDVGEVHRARYGRVKRLMDIGFGLAGSCCSWSWCRSFVVGDLFANRGPMLFGQTVWARAGDIPDPQVPDDGAAAHGGSGETTTDA